MDLLWSFVDLFLRLDEHLSALIQQYGVWIYLILFAVIFCETGLVITPGIIFVSVLPILVEAFRSGTKARAVQQE